MENGANPSGNKRRRKRSASSSSGNKKIKYGCPTDFARVSQKFCLHYHVNSKGQGVRKSFDESKAYCTKKDNKASLLYLENARDASLLWKWLGKIIVFFN